MAASLGDVYGVVNEHYFSGKGRLVPLFEEDIFENPAKVTKGLCCNKCFNRFFFQRKRDVPPVHTFVALLQHTYCVFLFILNFLVLLVCLFCCLRTSKYISLSPPLRASTGSQVSRGMAFLGFAHRRLGLLLGAHIVG